MWTEQAYLKANNTNANNYVDNYFGNSVSISAEGNALAVDAYGETSYAGAAYVFTRSGATWTQQAYIKASNAEAGDEFGSSVSISAHGNTLAVGAFGEGSDASGIGINEVQTNNLAPNSGAVYTYTRSGIIWSQQAYIKAPNTGAKDRFSKVALSADGDTLAVGAREEDGPAAGVNAEDKGDGVSNAGAVYLY